MSETKHTPGPWRVVLHMNSCNGGFVTAEGFDRNVICRVTAKADRPTYEKEANLDLIAAAPDLLIIAERWAALDGGAWHVQRHAKEKAELLSDTRAAILRARGGKPEEAA